MSESSLMRGVYRSGGVIPQSGSLVDHTTEVTPGVDDRGNLRVAVANSTDRTATGTINEATPGVGNVTNVEINSQGCGTVGVDLRTTNFNGTLVFEATVDGTNWETIPAITPTTGAEVTSIALVGAAYSELFTIPSAGYAKVRVRCSVYAAGTIVVSLEASSAGQDVSLSNPLPVGDNTVGRVKLTDGTTVEKIMAASTAAAFTDPAAAVDVRPGGVFPAGAVPANGESYGTLSKIRAMLMAKTSGATTLDIVLAGLSGVQSSIAGVLNTQPMGKYVSSVYALLDGQFAEWTMSSRGALRMVLDEIAQAQDDTERVFYTKDRALATSTGAWTPYDSGTTLVGNVGLLVKATGGRAKRFYAQNTSATIDYYLVVVDKATAAIANDAVKASIWLPPRLATTTQSPPPILDLSDKYFTNGISVAISTTPEKVTLGTAVCHIWGDFL